MAVRRGVAVVLTVITLAVIFSFVGVAFVYVLLSRGPSIADDSTLVLRPAGQLQETTPDDVVGQLISSETTTVRSFVESLRLAKRDPRITGVLLMPSALESPFWGKVQELRDAVLDFRKSGKVVVAFLEFGGDREYYLASAADKVYLLPTSALDLTGVASYEVFLRGTLDKLGVYPDFLQIGDYKTAVNQLTQKSFTPAHREMTESLNGDMYEQLVRGIASARRKTEAETRQLLVEWNHPRVEYWRDAAIHKLFELQVEQGPESVALVFDAEKLTYRELNRRSNQLAHRLRSLGVGPEVRVGLLFERSVALIVGILGVLKAGGVYVPLDVRAPQERLNFILEDSACAVLLTGEATPKHQ